MTGLEFGILVTPVYGAETPYGQQLTEHRQLVQTAEQLGFGAMVAGQHFVGTELRYYQPVPYLVHLSHFAPSMKVVTGIILLSMVSPAETAESVATMDVVTGGRAIFGIGLGYAGHEFRAMGVDPRQKITRFEEGLTLIRALWSGKQVNEEGRYWKVDGAQPSVLPAQPGGPPVWIGGQADPAIARAARLGDAWYAPPFPSHAQLAKLRAKYLQIRAELGLARDGAFPVRRELIVAGSRAEACRLAAEYSQSRYETYRAWGLSGANQPVAANHADIDIDSQFILGSPNECADALAALRDDLGMTHFMFKAHWPGVEHREAMRQLERFGTEILPQLKHSA